MSQEAGGLMKGWSTNRMLPQGTILIATLFLVAFPLVGVAMGAPAPFASLNLNQIQKSRNLTVSRIDLIDVMDLGQSEVRLLSTIGDNTDIRILTPPRIQTIHRSFSKANALIRGNNLTILVPLNTSVSVSDFQEYPVFVERKIPVIECRIPGAYGDIFLTRANATAGFTDLQSLIGTTDRLYLLRESGALALEINPDGTIGHNLFLNISTSDFNQTDMAFTLKRNENSLSDFGFDRFIAQMLSASVNVTPKSGEFSLEAFQYDPGQQKITFYAIWPVVILDGDNPLVLSPSYHYEKNAPTNLTLTFEEQGDVANISYVMVKQDEDYEALVEVNMTALEEQGDGFLPEILASGNHLLSLLKQPGSSPPGATRVIHYSLILQGFPRPPAPSHPWEIAITPGYGISGFGAGSPSVVIPSTGLDTLVPGQYSLYALGTDPENTIIALDQETVTITETGLLADFFGTPRSGFVPLSVQFTDTSAGDPTLWDWDFGDGEGSASANPSHVYTSTGTFSVSLTVRDGIGNTSTKARPGYITVHPVPPAPVARFTANTTSGDAPLTVAFTDESSGSPYQWNWSFGDGEYSSTQHPVHTYRDAGNYSVSLTVRGLGGLDTETKPEYIHVLSHPPVADFIANPTSGDAPLSVQFTDLSAGGPTSWSWSFGDGGVSSARDPLHIYITSGNYTVNLTATNDQGSDTLSRTDYIVVTTPTPSAELHAGFVGSPVRGYYPLSVVFQDTSTGNPISWHWSFGDGTNSTEKDPIHIYRRSGLFTVTLTVSNATASDTLVRSSYITAIHQSGGGGGGGGGGTFIVSTNATPTVTTSPTVTPTYSGQLLLGPDNRTTQPVVIISEDGIFTLSLNEGVEVTGTGGVPVTGLNLSALQVGVLPPLPGDPWVFSGYACRVSPADATFDPGATLLLAFDEAQWTLLNGKGLVLMWYDPSTGIWQLLETSVNEEARSVSARITRGGIYGLFTGIPTTGPTVPEATPTPTGTRAEGVTSPWVWLVPVLVILIGVAAALGVYLFKIRPGRGKPPESHDISGEPEE